MIDVVPEIAIKAAEQAIKSGGLLRRFDGGVSERTYIDFADGVPTLGWDIDGLRTPSQKELIVFVFTVCKSALPPGWAAESEVPTNKKGKLRKVRKPLPSLDGRKADCLAALRNLSEPAGPATIAKKTNKAWCKDDGQLNTGVVKGVLDTLWK